MKSSISDDNVYPAFCEKAATTNLFYEFRMGDTEYKSILEHVTQEEGQKYLDIIIKNNNHLLDNIKKYQKNDIIGNPDKSKYVVGEFSPTTLRYIKVLSDIIDIYGNLDDKDIVEIGCGYGGQAKIICDTFNVKSYTLIDLNSVLKLIRRYLEYFDLGDKFKYVKMEDVENFKTESFDFCISNYAYSECDKNVQMLYYDKIISKSKNGYITANFISEVFNINSLSRNELLDLISNYKLIEENPKTHDNNIIITW